MLSVLEQEAVKINVFLASLKDKCYKCVKIEMVRTTLIRPLLIKRERSNVIPGNLTASQKFTAISIDASVFPEDPRNS